MRTSYKILFLVELLHDYYRNLQCRDLHVIPFADTALRFKDQQMICKMVGNKFIVLVKVNADDDKPIIPIDPATTFRFYLELINPHFVTVTRLDLDLKPRPCLYFNNLSQNNRGVYAYLSTSLPDHDAAVNYNKTNIVVKNSEVFECIKPTGGELTSNGDFWQKRNAIVPFDIGTNYKEGDLVNDDGKVYLRLKDGSGRPTSDTLFWLLREDYPGLMILASNFKNNMDEAFLRRFHSLVHFPMPNSAERLLLWQKTMPAGLKMAHNINLEELSKQYEFSGASVLNAVQFAALQSYVRNDGMIYHKDLLDGIRKEYLKEDRSL